MLRPASFFSRSASFAVVGLASLRRASTIWTVPVGEVHLAPLAAFAVSAGVCRAGRIRTVVTGFGLSPAVEGSVICASAPSPAQAPNATTNKVAESTVLMTNPKARLTGIRVGILGSLQVRPIMHICLVGNNRTPVQGNQPHPEEARSAVS